MPMVNSKEMFKKAYEGGYAIGAFNVNNMEIIQGITEGAKLENAPLILQVSAGARKYAKHVYLMKMIEAAIADTDLPIVVHLDHGPDFETCKSCIDGGFTSVMIDCSETPFGTAETSDSAKQTCRSGNRNRSASATTAVLNSSIIDVPAAAVAVLPVIVYSDAVTGRKLVRKTERFKNACRVISNSVFSAVYRMPDSAKTSSSSTALSSTLEAESPRTACSSAASSSAERILRIRFKTAALPSRFLTVIIAFYSGFVNIFSLDISPRLPYNICILCHGIPKGRSSYCLLYTSPSPRD